MGDSGDHQRAFATGAGRRTVLLHAAGSLRGALTEVAAAFTAATGDTVQPKFGASGLLKDEIAAGGKAEVFASANMEHPLALAMAKRAGPVVLFARNQLCAIVRPGLAVAPDTLLDRMLDPVRPGAYAILEKKALQLTGGPSSPASPEGRTIYSVLIEQGAVDLFLGYCTAARAAQKENPGQQMVALPRELAVGADYGLTVVSGASTSAYRLALFILSPDAQRILEGHGFAAPNVPR